MSTSTRVDLEPGFILHGRAYRETSQLLEMFTANHGRVGVIARGSRRPKSAFRGLLDPFQPLRVSWSGRGELATLTHAEPSKPELPLTGQAVMAGFYANELVLKLLERRDPHPDLFFHYAAVINALRHDKQLEVSLRNFELNLLTEIGYGLNFATDSIRQEGLQAGVNYEFLIESGAVPVTETSARIDVYTGAQLLAIGQRDFSDMETLKAAKRLLRFVLNFHVGERGLQTRRIVAAMKRPA